MMCWGRDTVAWSDVDADVSHGLGSNLHEPADGWSGGLSDWGVASRKLASFEAMDEDWDGAGALAPDPWVLITAEYLLRRLERARQRAPSRILPSPSGEILFEWHVGDVYLEAEIVGLGEVEWMRVTPNNPPEHWRERLAFLERSELHSDPTEGSVDSDLFSVGVQMAGWVKLIDRE